ncbi:hypothetical protein GCM10017752_60160 [Streptomyces roseoviridis]
MTPRPRGASRRAKALLRGEAPGAACRPGDATAPAAHRAAQPAVAAAWTARQMRATSSSRVTNGGIV